MRRNLFWRLTLFFILFASLISLLFWLLQLYALPRLITLRTERELIDEATAIETLIAEAPSQSALLEVLEARDTQTASFITLYGQNGQILYSAMTQTPLRAIERDRLLNEASFTLISVRQNLPYLNYYTVSEGVILRLAIPLQTYDRQLGLINQLFFGALILSLTLGVVLAWWFSKTLTNPLNRLEKAVSTWNEFSLPENFIVEGEDEIAKLSQSFYDLSLRLNATYKQLQDELQKATALEQAQKDFLAQASHELKTPLSIIQASLETLSDGVLTTKDEQASLYQSMTEETLRMQTLVEQLLKLVKLEQTEPIISFTQCDIKRLTLNVIERLSLIYPLKPNVTLKGNHFLVNGDEASLWLALRNLIENAQQHKKLDNITISILDEKDALVWRIENQYDASNPLDESKLTQPFVKKNPSDQRHGLGLTLVKRVIDRHQATLSIETTNPFIVTLTFKKD